MLVFRLLALSLLGSISIPAAVAQSTQSPPTTFNVPIPLSSPASPLAPNPSFDLRSPARAFLPDSKDANHLTPSFKLGNPFAGTLTVPRRLDDLRARLSKMRGALSAQNEQLCYAIRDYRFTRGTPDLDVTKLSSYSTCQPASQFQVKTIVAAPALLR